MSDEMKQYSSGDSDPKLLAIIQEISAILKKHDVGGFVNLISKTHGEWGISFPSWSGLSLQRQPGGEFGIRLQMKADQVEQAELTAHFIVSNQNVGGLLYTTMGDLLAEVEKTGAIVTVNPHAH